MISKIKAVGLAFAAVLALGALTASAASAGVVMTEGEKYAAALHAEQVEGEKHVFTLTDDGNAKTECKKATFTGTLSAKSSTVRVHPTYSECTGLFGVSVTVTTTGCDYEFHIGETIGATGNYDGTTDMVCEAGKKITISGGNCLVEVGPQTGLSTVEGINMASDITVKAAVTKIAYSAKNNGFPCTLATKAAGVEGDYTGNTTVTATVGGVATNLTLAMS